MEDDAPDSSNAGQARFDLAVQMADLEESRVPRPTERNSQRTLVPTFHYQPAAAAWLHLRHVLGSRRAAGRTDMDRTRKPIRPLGSWGARDPRRGVPTAAP